MKRIISFFLALTMLFGVFSLTAFAVPGTLNLSVANVSGAPGSEVEVALNVSTNPGVAWIAVTLDYDKAALELLDVTNGSIIKDMDVGINLIWSADEDSTATGTLATLKFKILASTAGEYSVKLKGRECYGMEADVNLSITNGSITVGCAHKNTTSVPATQPGATTPGYTAGVYCNDCQTYISGHVEVPPTGGSDEGAKMIVSTERALPSKTVTLTVSLENNPGISAAALEIDYDSSRLSLDNAELSETFANGAFTNYNLPYLTFVRSGNCSENTILLTITFTVLQDAPVGFADVTIKYQDGDITNYDEEDVPFTVISGGVDVVYYVPGDVNGDEKVNSKDLTRLLKFISHEEVEVNDYAVKQFKVKKIVEPSYE